MQSQPLLVGEPSPSYNEVLIDEGQPKVTLIRTASWFTPLPADHVRIGISRGVPRRMPEGYRVYRRLAPGPWFNRVGVAEYVERYRAEVLAPLDAHSVAALLRAMAPGGVAVLLCYERPGRGDWCHRALAAQWLADALGGPVPEVGFEHLPQHLHPLLPEQIRRGAASGTAPAE